jgi:hypothetical protein
MVTLIERHLHGLSPSIGPVWRPPGGANSVSGRDGLIYIKGAIAPRGLIQLYGARHVFYNRIGYVAGRPDRSRAVCDL